MDTEATPPPTKEPQGPLQTADGAWGSGQPPPNTITPHILASALETTMTAAWAAETTQSVKDGSAPSPDKAPPTEQAIVPAHVTEKDSTPSDKAAGPPLSTVEEAPSSPDEDMADNDTVEPQISIDPKTGARAGKANAQVPRLPVKGGIINKKKKPQAKAPKTL